MQRNLHGDAPPYCAPLRFLPSETQPRWPAPFQRSAHLLWVRAKGIPVHWPRSFLAQPTALAFAHLPEARDAERAEDGRGAAGRIYTSRVIFTWDVRKNAANVKKHGVDFREAATVFYDPLSITFPDEDHSDDEERFLTIGASARGSVLVISHTEEGDTIRIISARAATPRERRFYEET